MTQVKRWRMVEIMQGKFTTKELLLGSICNEIEVVRRYLFGYGFDKNVIEDLISQTVLNAIECVDDLKDFSKLQHWLIKIARNNAIAYLKEMKKEEKTPINEYVEYNDILYRDRDSKDAYSILAQRETKQEIANCMNKLDKKYLMIICLTYYRDYSLIEISELLGINYNTVRTQYRRALAQLKELLLEENAQYKEYISII